MNIIKTCWGESVQLTRLIGANRRVLSFLCDLLSVYHLQPLPLFLSRTGIEMYMKSSKKNGVQGSSPSLRQIPKPQASIVIFSDWGVQSPQHSIQMYLVSMKPFSEDGWITQESPEEISKILPKSWFYWHIEPSPRHHSMLHDIVHKEKAARGAIEDLQRVQQKKSIASLVNSCNRRIQRIIYEKTHFRSFLKRVLIWGMLGFGRQELLAQEKVERSKHHASVEERAIHSDFPATSMTAAVSLSSQQLMANPASPTRFNSSLLSNSI